MRYAYLVSFELEGVADGTPEGGLSYLKSVLFMGHDIKSNFVAMVAPDEWQPASPTIEFDAIQFGDDNPTPSCCNTPHADVQPYDELTAVEKDLYVGQVVSVREDDAGIIVDVRPDPLMSQIIDSIG